MTEPQETWWWVSFADEHKFLGVVITQAPNLPFLITSLWMKGLNPGGELAAIEIPPQHVPPVEYRDRLLTRDEADIAGI